MTIKMAFMFYINLTPLFLTIPTHPFISYNEVSGIAIEKENILYTLNFDQQNNMLKYLNDNQSSLVSKQPPLDFEKMIIYRFNQPEIIIHK
jgi:hypothetical protein